MKNEKFDRKNCQDEIGGLSIQIDNLYNQLNNTKSQTLSDKLIKKDVQDFLCFIFYKFCNYNEKFENINKCKNEKERQEYLLGGL